MRVRLFESRLEPRVFPVYLKIPFLLIPTQAPAVLLGLGLVACRLDKLSKLAARYLVNSQVLRRQVR